MSPTLQEALGDVVTSTSGRDKRRALLAAATHFACVFVLGGIILFLNPWKIGDWSKFYSDTIIHRALAVSFHWKTPTKTVVILADDRFFDQPDPDFVDDSVTWPLRYSIYADILSRAHRLGARAVFLDFTLADTRPDKTYAAFLRELERVAPEMPVFIAAGLPESGFNHVARPELLELARRGAGVYLISPLSGARSAPDLPTYRLSPSQSGIPSFPVALSRRFCITQNCAPILAGPDMELVWPAPPDPANCIGRAAQAAYDGCDALATSPLPRLAQVLLLPVMRDVCRATLGRIRKMKCFPEAAGVIANRYTPELSLDEMLDGQRIAETYNQLHGAIVLVGTDFAYAQDRVSSPVYGEVPAVHAHAVALTNIGTFGSRYFRAPPSDPDRVAVNDVLIYLVILSIALGVYMLIGGSAHVSGLENGGGGRFRLAVVCAVIAVETSLVVHRSSPSNWIGAYLAVEFSEAALKRWLWVRRGVTKIGRVRWGQVSQRVTFVAQGVRARIRGLRP